MATLAEYLQGWTVTRATLDGEPVDLSAPIFLRNFTGQPLNYVVGMADFSRAPLTIENEITLFIGAETLRIRIAHS